MVATIASPACIGVIWTVFRPWVGWAAIMQILAVSVLGFFAVWGIIFVACLIQSPAQLDAQQAERHKRDISGVQLIVQQKSTDLESAANRIARLEEELLKKHPHDAYKEGRATEALECLNDTEREVIRWLLDSGKVSRGLLQQRGLNADAVHGKMQARLLLYDSFRPGNGTVEMDRFYYVNPEFLNALRAVLYVN